MINCNLPEFCRLLKPLMVDQPLLSHYSGIPAWRLSFAQ